jgi:glycosyltransferase involved in cell wall biosynthesis
MNVRLLLGGKAIEDPNFWHGFNTEPAIASSLYDADLVVQPCIVESQPRALLRAIVAGVPVITTPNSGLHANCPAHLVSPLDAFALRNAIAARLAEQTRANP